MPATRVEFWRDKFERNVARDLEHQAELRELGWRVIVLWECEIAKSTTREERLGLLAAEIAVPYESNK